MYDDLKTHLQEILDIGTICKSYSPSASKSSCTSKERREPEVLDQPLETEQSDHLGYLCITPDRCNHQQPAGVLNGFLTGSEIWILASRDELGVQTSNCFYGRAIGLLQVQKNALQVD